MTHHICNFHFERELDGLITSPLETSFTPQQKLLLPLPKVWALPGDTVFPEDVGHCDRIESWGPSLVIKEYAKRKNLAYDIPDWELLKKIQSKFYSHSISPLPGSAILKNEQELKQWVDCTEPPFVFKLPFGYSGIKHLFRPEKLTFPILAEPWVERDFDFSTNWYVEKGVIEYLGATRLYSSDRGKYLGSLAGDEKELFYGNEKHLAAHKDFVVSLLEQLDDFFGHIGFDAFVYGGKLQPICEINARRTMGWAAMELQKAKAPKEKLVLRFGKEISGRPLFPEIQRDIENNKIPISHQLKFDVL